MIRAVLLPRLVLSVLQEALRGFAVKRQVCLGRECCGACRANRPQHVQFVRIEEAHRLDGTRRFILRTVAVTADAVLHRRYFFWQPTQIGENGFSKIRAEQVVNFPFVRFAPRVCPF